MARIATAGFEACVPTNNVVSADNPLGGSIFGTLTRDTTNQRTGNGCLGCASGASNAAAYLNFGNGKIVASGTYFFRAYIRFDALPSGNTEIIILGSTGVAGLLKSTGKLALWNETSGTQIGSDSATTLAINTWYRLELKAITNASNQITDAELLLDGVQVAIVSGQTIAVGSSNAYVGWTVAPGASKNLYVDDVALNDATGTHNNGYPGSGKVVMLIPVSDNAVGTGWTLGTGTAISSNSGSTAVKNEPPLGVADLAAGSDTKQVRNATANASVNFDENLTTYTNGGVGSSDTINVVIPWICTGAASATSPKSFTVGVSSNPVISQGASTSCYQGSSVMGTYPTGWKWTSGTQTEAPTVTLGSSPVMRCQQVTSSTRIIGVCFMGMYVDYTPSGAITVTAPPAAATAASVAPAPTNNPTAPPAAATAASVGPVLSVTILPSACAATASAVAPGLSGSSSPTISAPAAVATASAVAPAPTNLVTSPPSCAAAQAVFADIDRRTGHTALETGEGGWQGFSAAQKVTAARTEWVTEIQVWMFNTSGGADTSRAALAADDNGGSAPGTRLAISSDLSVTNVGQASVWRFRFPTPVQVISGTSYWIETATDSGGNMNLYTGSPGTGGIKYISGSTLPSNWSSVSSDDPRGPMSMFWVGYANKDTIWEGGFESGDLSEFSNSFQQAAGRFTAVTSDAGVWPRSGSYMGRIEVRSGDDPISTGGNICEAYLDPTSGAPDDHVGDERYYAFSLYLPPGFQFVPNNLFNYFFELHSDSSTAQAPLKLGINDIINAGNPSTSFHLELNTGNPASPTQTIWRLGNLITGQWVRFVIHVKWATDTTGLVECWMNGVQVASSTGIQTWYTSGATFVRLQMGYYRAAVSQTVVLYEDDIRIGNTYESVAPQMPQIPTVTMLPPPATATASSVAPTLALVSNATIVAPPAIATASSVAPVLKNTATPPPAIATASNPTTIVAIIMTGAPATATASSVAASMAQSITVPSAIATAASVGPVMSFAKVPPPAIATAGAAAPTLFIGTSSTVTSPPAIATASSVAPSLTDTVTAVPATATAGSVGGVLEVRVFGTPAISTASSVGPGLTDTISPPAAVATASSVPPSWVLTAISVPGIATASSSPPVLFVGGGLTVTVPPCIATAGATAPGISRVVFPPPAVASAGASAPALVLSLTTLPAIATASLPVPVISRSESVQAVPGTAMASSPIPGISAGSTIFALPVRAVASSTAATPVPTAVAVPPIAVATMPAPIPETLVTIETPYADATADGLPVRFIWTTVAVVATATASAPSPGRGGTTFPLPAIAVASGVVPGFEWRQIAVAGNAIADGISPTLSIVNPPKDYVYRPGRVIGGGNGRIAESTTGQVEGRN